MKLNLILAILIIFLVTSCKKFLVVDPPANQATTDRVFASNETAIATVNGIYAEMMTNGSQFSASGITFYAGMCADELRYYGPSERDEFINNAIADPGQTTLELYFWNMAYKYIYAANLTIDKLNTSSAISKAVKDQLNSEAKFIRAFCYFYLVNLFGDVPLATTSDYRVNEKLGRSPVAAVYDQIKIDLNEAVTLLTPEYNNGERVRPTRWAALALSARVYLYLQQWVKAEQFATEIINSGKHSLVANPSEVFLMNSNEAIWQLLPVNPAFNTWEGLFILPASVTAPPTYIFDGSLVSSIEAGDLRKAIWFASRDFQSQTFFYPSKYAVRGINVPITEYYMVLRLAELYLIRAEARVQQNKVSESIADLNIIRSRAGLPSTAAATPGEILFAIEKERRIELAAEWGHRWFDLKRTNRADVVLAPVKPQWQATDVLWPLPMNQIRANPKLVQNPGY